jgi:Cyclic nucleotide-binding domain
MNDRADEIRSARAPKLREDQIEVLRRYGKTRKAEAGEVLFRAGDASNDFIVVLEGEVEVVDDFAGEARTMGVMRAGRFVGDLNMLTGQAMYLSAVVGEGGEVLAIPRERLKEVVTEEPNFSDVILKAFLARRSPRIVYRQTGRCFRLMCEGTTGQGGEVCLRGDGRKRGPGLLRPDPCSRYSFLYRALLRPEFEVLADLRAVGCRRRLGCLAVRDGGFVRGVTVG